jgi:predicted metal-dependent hydrolase
MRNLDDEIKELSKMTARVLYDFVQAELQTCFTCVDMGTFQLGIGNTRFAKEEAAVAERGIQEVKRFAGKLPAEQRVQIDKKLVQVAEAVDELKRAIQAGRD